MTTALYVPGVTEQDPKKLIRSQQLIAGQTAAHADSIAANTTDISTANTNITALQTAVTALQGASYVNSIAGRTGVITLNATSGITNSANDVILQQGSSSQFGAVKVDGTTIKAVSGVISTVGGATQTAAIGADVSLNNTANYFDGPSISQGSTGTWYVTGAVVVSMTAGSADQFNAKLWDGTTVIASGVFKINAAVINIGTITLAGIITSPAGNLKISVNDQTSTGGKILFNASGNSKDSWIAAVRIG